MPPGSQSPKDEAGSTPASIWVCSAAFPGTSLEPAKLSNLHVTASYDPQASQSSVPFKTLSYLLGVSEHARLLQELSNPEPLYVLIGWRMTERTSPVFQTRLLVVQDGAEGTSRTCHIIFNKPLSWAETIVRNDEKFVKAAAAAAAAAARAQRLPLHQPHPSLPSRQHNCKHCAPALARATQPPSWRGRRAKASKPAPGGEPRALRGLLPLPRPNSAAKTGNSRAEIKLAQSYKLVEALRRHGEQVFRETGDTRELLQATLLAQRLLGGYRLLHQAGQTP